MRKSLVLLTLLAFALQGSAQVAKLDQGRWYITATIANGESLSAGIDTNGLTVFAVQMPAAWTAASLTFEVSIDGETWGALYDSDGVEVAVPVSAGGVYSLSPSTFAGYARVKVRSGTASAAVNQGAARSLLLSLGKV